MNGVDDLVESLLGDPVFSAQLLAVAAIELLVNFKVSLGEIVEQSLRDVDILAAPFLTEHFSR